MQNDRKHPKKYAYRFNSTKYMENNEKSTLEIKR